MRGQVTEGSRAEVSPLQPNEISWVFSGLLRVWQQTPLKTNCHLAH